MFWIIDVPIGFRNVIKPDLMEGRIVSAIVKHMDLGDTVSDLLRPAVEEDSNKRQQLEAIMMEVYKKTDALARRLQVRENCIRNVIICLDVKNDLRYPIQILSELEQKWYTELEDIRKGLMPAYMSFFAMHHLLEVPSCSVSYRLFCPDGRLVNCDDVRILNRLLVLFQVSGEGAGIAVLPEGCAFRSSRFGLCHRRSQVSCRIFPSSIFLKFLLSGHVSWTK